MISDEFLDLQLLEFVLHSMFVEGAAPINILRGKCKLVKCESAV
jgi:hypothetical protein